jgi:hypothetical protein
MLASRVGTDDIYAIKVLKKDVVLRVRYGDITR